MKRSSPDKKVVVFFPQLDRVQRVVGPDGVVLQQPWAQEVSELPGPGDYVALYGVHTNGHPKTRPDRGPDGKVRMIKPALWKVTNTPVLHVPDLDVYVIVVMYETDAWIASELRAVLPKIGGALDLPYPYNENETEGK